MGGVVCQSALAADWDSASDRALWAHLGALRPSRSVAVRRGAVVVVRFRASGAESLRPAVCLAVLERRDALLAQVTATPCGDRHATGLPERCFARGSLQALGFVRPGRLFVAPASTIERAVAVVTEAALAEIVSSINDVLRETPRISDQRWLPPRGRGRCRW